MPTFTVKILTEMPPELPRASRRWAPLIKALQDEAVPGWGVLVEPDDKSADDAALKKLDTAIKAAIKKIGGKTRVDYGRRAVWAFLPERLNPEPKQTKVEQEATDTAADAFNRVPAWRK